MTEKDLAHEERVVWLEDTEPLDYVRQTLDRSPRRRSQLRHTRDGRMVGFAVLGADAPPDPCSGLFRRRVFFLLPHDRDSCPDGLYRDAAPEEAVDPRTVIAGGPGRKTARSQHRAPAPEQT
jgi:hypothetical protein